MDADVPVGTDVPVDVGVAGGGEARGVRPGAAVAGPTLSSLSRSLGPARPSGVPERFADRPVRGVRPLDASLALPSAELDLRDVLVLLPPGAAGTLDPVGAELLLRRLTERRVAGLACPAGPDGRSAPAVLAAAAERVALPLLAVPEGVDWPQVAQAVSDERHRAAQAGARLPGELLARLRGRSDANGGQGGHGGQGMHGGSGDGDGTGVDGEVQAVLDWLARTVAGEVVLIAATGAPTAQAPAGARELPPEAAPSIARVRAGELDAAGLDLGSGQLRRPPHGQHPPRPVLAVRRTAPFDPGLTHAMAGAADLLPLLLRLREANARELRAHRLLAAARVGVLQMLMGGELLLAQRTAASVDPGLLDAEQARVLILQGRPEDREGAVAECGAATVGAALVVRCPVYDGNVIIVAPVHGDARPGADWDTVRARLRGVVAARPDRYLGGSGTAPLAATAQSYRDAARALAVARQLAERVALGGARIELVEVLDQRARPWADALLGPALALPRGEREPLLDTLRLVLEFGVTGAARLTGRHRNTVSGTRKRAAALLALDLGDVLTRARLDLALQLQTASEPPSGTLAERPVPLARLLAADPARGWAQRWLAPLAQDGRDLRRTLLTWVGCNTRVERAAARLGLYPDTVRDHLKAADRLLQRDLLSPSGPHDLVLSLLAVGAIGPSKEAAAEPH
ncbi:helix-turn-helix domain-containing protein [Kitasatospora sp. NBC_01302]|uniref:helix-turn-helix domain-containing protein n=1 Tax=Kitasatospora sp. NBC_01302 TaxID=2903575 RepID=UPI002E0E64FF|nr:helix-turn-helix domain-containing protein [Kitasatospora sp. NBC_01302]